MVLITMNVIVFVVISSTGQIINSGAKLLDLKDNESALKITFTTYEELFM